MPFTGYPNEVTILALKPGSFGYFYHGGEQSMTSLRSQRLTGDKTSRTNKKYQFEAESLYSIKTDTDRSLGLKVGGAKARIEIEATVHKLVVNVFMTDGGLEESTLSIMLV